MNKFTAAWRDTELRRDVAMAASRWIGWQVVKVVLRLALELLLQT
ncbi:MULTISPECIES: hypothetical protein [unclassified Streptomyces]|nr:MULTISPECIES: hypothetical protein [unclassified Streptomyces]